MVRGPFRYFLMTLDGIHCVVIGGLFGLENDSRIQLRDLIVKSHKALGIRKVFAEFS